LAISIIHSRPASSTPTTSAATVMSLAFAVISARWEETSAVTMLEMETPEP
jgi:hypothetical protein